MKLLGISRDDASAVWNAMASTGQGRSVNVKLEVIGSGKACATDDDFEELIDQLERIMGPYQVKYPENLPRSVGGEVDAKIIQPIHSTLTRLTNVENATDPRFWRWLSNVACRGRFWNFIDWRFKERKQINWGITTEANMAEVYFFRAWLRGHKMYDATLPNPYQYAELGGSEIWRSHLLRVEFGLDQTFVKSFLRFCHDADGKRVINDVQLRTKLIPALRAWSSGATFAHLTGTECDALIRHLYETYE